jgi:hypothetical protein
VRFWPKQREYDLKLPCSCNKNERSVSKYFGNVPKMLSVKETLDSNFTLWQGLNTTSVTYASSFSCNILFVFFVVWSCGEFDVHSFNTLPYTIWLLDCIYYSVITQELNWTEVKGLKHLFIFLIIPRHVDLRIVYVLEIIISSPISVFIGSTINSCVRKVKWWTHRILYCYTC